MRMPHKQELVKQIMEWLNGNVAVVIASFAAFLAAFIKSMMDGRGITKSGGEAIICAAFAVGALNAAELLDMSRDLFVFIGVSIGYVGSERAFKFLLDTFLRIIGKK